MGGGLRQQSAVSKNNEYNSARSAVDCNSRGEAEVVSGERGHLTRRNRSPTRSESNQPASEATTLKLGLALVEVQRNPHQPHPFSL
jgi:hypothetical protein